MTTLDDPGGTRNPHHLQTGSFFTRPNGIAVSISASKPDTFTGPVLASAAPPWPLLRTYQADHDWTTYAQHYVAVLDKREPIILSDLAALTSEHGDLTLCCWCHSPDKCHRRLFAEWLQSHDQQVVIA